LIDQSILVNKNFEKRYTRASGKIQLLQRVRQYLTVEAAEKINLQYDDRSFADVKIPLTSTQTLLLT